jgi:hypothetical protein
MTDLTPNVYAHYKLNSVSGITAIDSSVNGRDGTLINMEDVDWVAGKLNNCLQFDGVNEYVNCGNIANFERTDSFSLECWFKTTIPITTMTYLLSKRGTFPYRGWGLGLSNQGKIYFSLCNTANINTLKTETTQTFNDSNWHHIIVTYDGSSNAAGIKIYVDNIDEPFNIVSNTLNATILISQAVNINSRSNGMYPLTGLIDEAVIYDKELSQEEVTFRWNSGNGRENFATQNAPSNPDPTDTATDINYNQNLNWDADADDTFDIYIGTSNPPPLVESDHATSDYDLSNLDSCTQYYWKIAAKNTWGDITESSIWSFTTGNELPVTPYDNSPVHKASNQELNLTLSWDCEDYNPNDTLTYDIYFGKSDNPSLIKASHTTKTYSVSGLEYNETYHWKIIAKDNATCGVHEITSPTWKFTTREEALGGYKSYDPREVIRENIGKSKYRVGDSEEEYWMFEVKDKLTDDIEIPLYLAEEVKSGSIKEMPFIDMNLMQVEYAPHDIGARTRRHKAWLDIGLWYADTDNIDRHDFGKKIVDKLIDKIRSTQCGMTHIDFINVESVRLLREPGAHQVIYHYVISIYCLFYDLGTDSY